MENYTHIIWDFNGTLYDDVDVCLSCANRLMQAHGLSPLSSVEDYRKIFGFPIVDYYARMGFDFEKTPYADLAVEWVAYYNEESIAARLADGARAILSAIQAKGISQLVLSATEQTMLERQITSLGIRDYFDKLLGLSNIHAHGKTDIALAWKQSQPNARLLMIGDTDHDAAVAKAIGADCILVASGHQSRATLESCNPKKTVEGLTDLLAFL